MRARILKVSYVFAMIALLTQVVFAQQDSTSGSTSVEAALGLPNQELPVVVKTSFHLQDISDVSDQNETFQFTGVLTLTWKDERQAFDPAKEDLKEKVYQGSYQVDEIAPSWYPQVILANQSGLYDKSGTILRVRPDGTSTLIETVSGIAKTDLFLRRYPFDSQRLQAVFEVVGFNRKEVVLEPDVSQVDHRPYLAKLPQWRVRDISVSGDEQLPERLIKGEASSLFVVNIDVKRKYVFALRLIVMPLAIMVMLSWSVFWMERSSLGDRINVSFIGILTAVAYQIVVADALPHIAYITLINIFLNVSFWLMCASVVINLWVGGLDKQGRSIEGDRLDRRCRWLFPLVYVGSLTLATLVIFTFF